MWVLSPDAGTLLSVVQFDLKKTGAQALAKKHGATDPDGDYLLVRARVSQSLGYVKEVLEALHSDDTDWTAPMIHDMKSADYRYRTIITREDWKRYLTFEVDGIDYDSHVKEETVRRQPEPKIGNLYTALSATWSAWAKLQPTPPYNGKSWTSKPDCKNCGHTELRHSVKGDLCNEGWKYSWQGGKQMQIPDPGKTACDCTKYEPKPKPAPAAPAVPPKGEAWKGTYTITQPAVPAPQLDAIDAEVVPEDTAWDAHEGWCEVWDGGSCICQVEQYANLEDELLGEYPSLAAELEGTGLLINGLLVAQEPAVPGETKREKKNRLERNRRARRRARRATQVDAL